MNFSFLVLALLFLKSKCDNKNEKPTTGGLKWVTFNQWVEMPGGADANPSVRLSTYGDDICSVDHDGCWQGGKINHVYGNIIFINRYLLGKKEILSANNWHFINYESHFPAAPL